MTAVTTERAWVVEVNECRVLATRMGADWWLQFRMHFEDIRIEVIKATIGGDLVHVACDSQDDARDLAEHMKSVQGLPASGIKVKAVTR